jgi:hypothetical protein
MRDGRRHRPIIHEWPAEFEPYAPRYQPRFDERKVSTRTNQELKPLPIPKTIEGKEACAATRKKPAVPKYRGISTIRDFPPIPGRFNPHLSDERKRAMHTHLT